jgi:hypothetical protein
VHAWIVAEGVLTMPGVSTRFMRYDLPRVASRTSDTGVDLMLSALKPEQ